MKYSLVENLQPHVWDKLLSESPQQNIYMSMEFLNSINVQFELIGVAYEEILVLGAVIIKKEGKPIEMPYPYTMYQGLLYSEEIDLLPLHSQVRRKLEALDYLLKQLSGTNDQLSFSFHHSITDVRSFQWFNYHNSEKGLFGVEVRYSGILDLEKISKFRNYYRSLRHCRREDYKRAKNRGYRTTTSSEISLIRDLYTKTFNRQGLGVDEDDLKIIESIATGALKHGFGKLFVCKNDKGQVGSVSLMLFDSRTAYYAIGASDPKLRKDGTGTMILVDGIEHFYEAGVQYFDVVGLNSPLRGDFKTSFNVKPVPYFNVTWKNPKPHV